MGIREATDITMIQLSDFFEYTYNYINDFIPEKYRIVSQLLFYSFFLVLYVWFIYRFGRFVYSRDIVKLDLTNFKWSNHPFLNKITSIGVFILQHIVVLPAIVIVWFTVMTMMFFVFVNNFGTSNLLFITTSLILVVRIASHYSEEVSKSVLNITSFCLVAIFLVSSNNFSIMNMILKIEEIPFLLETLLIYMVVILAVELILKLIVSFLSIIEYSSNEEEETTTVKELVESKTKAAPVIVKKEEVFDYSISNKVNKKNKYIIPQKKSK